jgi:hypothetical protein
MVIIQRGEPNAIDNATSIQAPIIMNMAIILPMIVLIWLLFKSESVKKQRIPYLLSKVSAIYL